ncbi:MAG: DNA-protecting protein DprA [Ruminococcaceae bacterium]|nr:DNA-protecting protein DprA [Oscillospiraceae bacterium]
MAALKYWVWLATLPGLTDRSKLLLLSHFASPEDIYYADPGQLRLVEGITDSQQQKLTDRSLGRAEQVLEDCAREGQFLITMQDAAYPSRLRNIFEPPILLFGRGKMPLFDEEAVVSVVGTRTCTPYGISTAEKLCFDMSRQGALVVSGLAKGIDAAAHRGALRAGGFTAAVLGGGVDVIYPQENRDLYEDIAATGVLLSEYPPGTRPLPHHFPERNRIISGLSLATLVVEAGEKSGALITAGIALEQGRDVFAVPGPVGVKESAGCNQLIREGAGLVQESWDILREYQSRFPHKLRRQRGKIPAVKPEQVVEETTPVQKEEPTPSLPVLTASQRQELTEDQLLVLQALDSVQARLTDDVAEATELPVQRVLAALTVLEINGMVCRQGARSFLRVVEIQE